MRKNTAFRPEQPRPVAQVLKCGNCLAPVLSAPIGETHRIVRLDPSPSDRGDVVLIGGLYRELNMREVNADEVTRKDAVLYRRHTCEKRGAA